MAHLSPETIIAACKTKQCGSPDSVRGFRLDDYWVKYGRVTSQEVSNQQHAYDNIDPRYGKVPKVHKYFTCDGTDYMVMEYVHGTCLDSLEWTAQNAIDLLDRLARLVTHVNSLFRTQPGPAGAGPQRGLLWGDDLQPTLNDKQDIEQIVRSRLRQDDAVPFDLSDTPLVFTHGDIARRNIITTPNDIYLIDWAFAGYLPRSAEIAALRMQNLSDMNDRAFSADIERKLLDLCNLSAPETLQVDAWQQFCYNNIAYYWPTPAEKQARTEAKSRRKKRRHAQDIDWNKWLDDLQSYAGDGSAAPTKASIQV